MAAFDFFFVLNPPDLSVEVKAGSSTTHEIAIRPNGAEGQLRIFTYGYATGIVFSIPPETTLTGYR
jgi:hypothetical protein